MKKQNNKVFKLIIIAILMLMIVNNVALSALDFFDGIMNNSLPTRTLSLTTYNDYDENKSFDVEELYRYLDKDEDIIGYQEYTLISLKDIDEVIRGVEFATSYDFEFYKDYLEDKSIKELKKNEIIIPKYSLDSYRSIEYAKRNEIIELNEYIGKTIRAKIDQLNNYGANNNNEYEFRIVGVYDNLKAGTETSFLVNHDFALEIMNTLRNNEEKYNETAEEQIYSGLEKTIEIVLKDYKKIEKKIMK